MINTFNINRRTEQVRRAINVAFKSDISKEKRLVDDKLFLDNNGIESLKFGDFAGLTDLKELDLSHNYLKELPEGIFDELPSLKRLSLNDNQLNRLPDGIFLGLWDLENLNLEWNNLKKIEKNVFRRLGKLKQVNLSGNRFEEFPVGIFEELFDLELLILSKDNFVNMSENDISISLLEGLSDLTFVKVDDEVMRVNYIRKYIREAMLIKIKIMSNLVRFEIIR